MIERTSHLDYSSSEGTVSKLVTSSLRWIYLQAEFGGNVLDENKPLLSYLIIVTQNNDITGTLEVGKVSRSILVPWKQHVTECSRKERTSLTEVQDHQRLTHFFAIHADQIYREAVCLRSSEGFRWHVTFKQHTPNGPCVMDQMQRRGR